MVDDQGRLKDGKVAAIKVLAADSRQGVKEFLTEINVISEIEHENLVKLYGCSVDKNKRILVYNYLENNSLSQTLLGKLFFFSRFLFGLGKFLFFTVDAYSNKRRKWSHFSESILLEYCWRNPFAKAFWQKLRRKI